VRSGFFLQEIDAIGMKQPFSRLLSCRGVRESARRYEEHPEFSRVASLLDAIDLGEMECLTLHGPAEEAFFVSGRSGHYYVNLFVDETEGHGFDDGSGDRSPIEIGGDFWPSFRVCRDKCTVLVALRDFYWDGCPPRSQGWFHYTDE
jgi:hypothetical protein